MQEFSWGEARTVILTNVSEMIKLNKIISKIISTPTNHLRQELPASSLIVFSQHSKVTWLVSSSVILYIFYK